MAVNSSFDNHPPPQLSSNSSSHQLLNECFRSKMRIVALSALSITCILLLPLSILVLLLGYRRWRRQCSTSTPTSHSDSFTYLSIVMQLIGSLGFICFYCGGFIDLPEMISAGLCIWTFTSLGVSLIHLLTCVERYLAVVHPVTYLSLKQTGGVRIRNFSIGCVWLLCFGCVAEFNLASSVLHRVIYYCSMVFFLIVMLFCSISVLCALKRPAPGEVGGIRERVDQSKQRAFYTMMAIMGALLLKFGGNLFFNVMYNSSVIIDACFLTMSIIWFDLPSTLVLPLLFLHRTGKLQRRKQNTESG